MAGYSNVLYCPSCNLRDLNLKDYTSLMVLKRGLGLFTMECPHCHAKITSIQEIPAELLPDIEEAAKKLGAGMDS